MKFFLGLIAFFYVLGFFYKYTLLSNGEGYSTKSLIDDAPSSYFLKPFYWVLMSVVVLFFLPFYFPRCAFLFCGLVFLVMIM